MKVDCNGRFVYLNPRRGAQLNVAEAARNVVCSGALPAAITNCLNFGNPYKPEMYWQFKEAVTGMGEACAALDTPVTGGNVSFYNESPDHAVFPTPTIGMLGLIEDVRHVTTSSFKNEGDWIYLLGTNRGEIGGSEYLKTIHGTIAGDVPTLDLSAEKSLQRLTLKLIQAGKIQSAHDVSDGGLAVALAECCLNRPGHGIGCRIHLNDDIRPDLLLFGEDASRIVLSVDPKEAPAVETEARNAGVPYMHIGTVGGDTMAINDWVKLSIRDIEGLYRHSIERMMSS
jgi:phosphoribosylformylglycinamidine synthase